MKRLSWILLLGLVLCGCSGEDSLERALEFRSRMLSASGCSFCAEVTADYTDKLYTFGMECSADADGKLSFRISNPETIQGISGRVEDSGGRLIFDDTVLRFDLLADRQLSPVSAPWVFVKSLRSGYIVSAGEEEGLLRMTLHDSYEEDALQVDVWMNETDQPVRCEILYRGKRILSVLVKDFELL